MGRARYYDVIQQIDPASGAFKPIPNPSVTVFNAGTTTPISQTIFAGPTGGTTLTQPIIGDTDGTIEFYLATPMDVNLLVSGVGVGSITIPYAQVHPAVEDQAFDGQSQPITMSGNLIVTALGSRFEKLGVGEVAAQANTTMNVVDNTQTAPGIVADFSGSATANGIDIGTGRFVMSQMTANTGNLLRALELDTLVDSPASGLVGSWIVEARLAREVASAHALDGAGFYITSEGFSPTITAPVRQGAALAVLGAAGWSDALYYLDTDGLTVLARITQTGQLTAGTVAPRVGAGSGGTFQCGTGSLPWLVVNTHNMSLTTDGTAAAPNINRFGIGTAGVYFPASGAQVGLTVGASDFAILTTSGLSIEKSLLGKKTTVSTPATGYSALGVKTDERWYRKTSAAAEFGLFDTGSTDIATTNLAANAVTQISEAVGSTGDPTLAVASGVQTVPEMTATITTVTGSIIEVEMEGCFKHNTVGGVIELSLRVDGGAEVRPKAVTHAVTNTPLYQRVSATFSGLSAASHTFDGRWVTSVGTATAHTTQRIFRVKEFRR